MYGLEINQLANLFKQSDPNRNDSDSEDDDQVFTNSNFFCFMLIMSYFSPRKTPLLI
jgi:hypothetical protein